MSNVLTRDVRAGSARTWLACAIGLATLLAGVLCGASSAAASSVVNGGAQVPGPRHAVVADRAGAKSPPVGGASKAKPEPPRIEPCKASISSYKLRNFVVWACGGLLGSISRDLFEAAGIIGDNWDRMAKFMGGGPLPDEGGIAGGGDTRIDFYLLLPGQEVIRDGHPASIPAGVTGVTVGEKFRGKFRGTTSSGYVLLLRKELEDSPAAFNSTEVHEFFHLLEDRYNTSSCDGDGGKFWFSEASAVWAETHFARKTAATEAEFRFALFQRLYAGRSLTDAAYNQDYQDFIWPYFMEQHVGAAKIAHVWMHTRGVTSCALLTALVNQQAPFAKYFGQFAVENFDSELPNTVDVKLPSEWPTDFGERYQDKPMDPNFPKVLPHISEVKPVSNPAYPVKEQENVNLPPLSAQYALFTFGPPPQRCQPDYPWTCTDGSLVFDFSHLSPLSQLDINLLGSEGTPGAKDAPHNGKWLHLKVSGDKASVCVNVDTGGKGGTKTAWYVIVDNHGFGSSAAPIKGTYTVEQRNACATSLKGTVTTDWQQHSSSNGTTYNYEIKDRDNMRLDDSATGWSVAKGSTWSVPKFTDVLTSPGSCSSGGGTETVTLDVTSGDMNSGDAHLFAYDGAYSGQGYKQPLFWGGLLTSEMVPATDTYCGQTSSTMITLGTNGACQKNKNNGQGLYGEYQAEDADVNFDCAWGPTPAQGGQTFALSVSGTLSATDPLTCGLWSTDCSIGSASIAAGSPRPQQPAPRR
jgi:hypothetical protein